MKTPEERREEFRQADLWFQRHPGWSWIIAIGAVFAIVGFLCCLTFLTRLAH